MALALVLVGAGVGGSISAPLLTSVIAAEHGNWRAGWFCLSAAGLAGALVSILFVKNRPEDVGQVADGGRNKAAKSQATSPLSARVSIGLGIIGL